MDRQTPEQPNDSARRMLDYYAEVIARDVARAINERTAQVKFQYAPQYTLEKVIESLQARV